MQPKKGHSGLPPKPLPQNPILDNSLKLFLADENNPIIHSGYMK
jgi:hypothetical protein